MAATKSPTVRRRRLSLALKAFRVDADLKSEEVAKRLGWPTSKVTRIERNEWRRPGVGDVMDLLDLYEITDQAKRDALITLAREAGQRGWWEQFDEGVLPGALAGFEAEASEIQLVEGLLVPGLMQTRDYAAAVFAGGQVLDPAVIEQGVQARMSRQKILDRDDPPTVWAVIDEAALRKHVGGVAVMRHQISHLIALAKRPNIGIQVIPDAVGAHASLLGGFAILNYAQPSEDPSLVYVEIGGAGDLYMEKPEQVKRYRVKYDHVHGAALSASDSVPYMRELIKQLE